MRSIVHIIMNSWSQMCRARQLTSLVPSDKKDVTSQKKKTSIGVGYVQLLARLESTRQTTDSYQKLEQPPVMNANEELYRFLFPSRKTETSSANLWLVEIRNLLAKTKVLLVCG